MKNRLKPKLNSGFTLIELMITITIMTIVILGVGVVVVNGQNRLTNIYSRVSGEPANDAYVATQKFSYLVRKSAADNVILGSSGETIELHYYNDSTSSEPDRYARFYVSAGDLYVEQGILSPLTSQTNEKICSNVAGCTFLKVNNSAQIALTLDDGVYSLDAVTSAIMHN